MPTPTTALTTGELKAAMARLARTILSADEWRQSSWSYGPGKWALRGRGGDHAMLVAGRIGGMIRTNGRQIVAVAAWPGLGATWSDETKASLGKVIDAALAGKPLAGTTTWFPDGDGWSTTAPAAPEALEVLVDRLVGEVLAELAPEQQSDVVLSAIRAAVVKGLEAGARYRSCLQTLEQELMQRSGQPLPVEPQRFIEALAVVYERLVDIERVEYVSLYRVRRILGIILGLDEIGFNRMLQEVFPKLVSGAMPGYRIALEVDATPRELATIRRRNWHILIDGIPRHVIAMRRVA